MAQVKDFSPEQIEEARKWFQDNHPKLLLFCTEAMQLELYNVFFELKMLSI